MTAVDVVLLERVAADCRVSDVLLHALVQQESGGDPWAYRPEPQYRWFWDVRRGERFRTVSPDEVASKIAPPDFPTLAGSRNQEWWGQQASWGLCQIMGAVAREHGFRAPFLSALCEPEPNLRVGCLVLRGHLAWAHGDERLALAAYNAGRGGANSAAAQDYATSVLDRKARLA